MYTEFYAASLTPVISIKKMKFSLIVLRNSALTLAVLIFLSCQNIENEEVYNLNFDSLISMSNPTNTWKITGCLAHVCERDTVNLMEGKASAYVKVFPELRNRINPLKIFQSLEIPTNVKDIDISFWMKSEKLSSGSVEVQIFDSNENLISTNVIPLAYCPNWKKINAEIKNNCGRILYLELKIGNRSALWLDDLKISLNGKISSPASKLNKNNDKKNPLSNYEFSNLSHSSSLSQITNSFDDKKVIGIGETCHGIQEMAEIRNSLIIDLILNHQCKLVVLECPELYATRFNDYINGRIEEETLFTVNDVAYTQFFNLSEKMLELLQWMRKFNDTAVRKITIAGMDVSQNWKEPMEKGFYQLLSKQDALRITNYLQKSATDSLLNFINNNKTRFSEKIGPLKYDSLYTMAVKNNQFRQVYSSFFNDRSRDSIMALNVIELTKKYITENEKVVVCGHLSHLNKIKVDNSINPSTGYYLNTYFSKKYFVLGLHVGEGNYQAYQIDPKKLNIHALPPPSYGSLEYYSSKMTTDLMFVKLMDIESNCTHIMSYRFVGGIPKVQQFFPCNPIQRIDAFIYIPKGYPLKLLPIYSAK